MADTNTNPLLIPLDGLNNTRYENLPEFITALVNLAASIAALVAVVFLIYAGFQYITSRGEGEKAEEAQKSIIYILVGLVICFLAPLVINFVLNNIIQATLNV